MTEQQIVENMKNQVAPKDLGAVLGELDNFGVCLHCGHLDTDGSNRGCDDICLVCEGGRVAAVTAMGIDEHGSATYATLGGCDSCAKFLVIKA